MSGSSVRKGLKLQAKEEIRGVDLVTGMPHRFARGFALRSWKETYGPNPEAFGHAGAGGSIGFADPKAHVGIGYAMNQMQIDPDDESRAAPLGQGDVYLY